MIKKSGSREDVWNRRAQMTTGKLTRKDLVKRDNKIMSRKMIIRGKLLAKHNMSGGSSSKKTGETVERQLYNAIIEESIDTLEKLVNKDNINRPIRFSEWFRLRCR